MAERYPLSLRCWAGELGRIERWAALGVPPDVESLTLAEMEGIDAIRQWKLERQWGAAE